MADIREAPAEEAAGAEAKRLIFLHLPKTAGQSVRRELTRAFGAAAVAPVRVNGEIDDAFRRDMARYRVFTGHIDWTEFDRLPEPKRFFTILRDPLERICSFYLYQLRNAKSAEEGRVAAPNKRGLRLVRTLSVDDYFCADLPERGFLDNNYDNLYTHYFAGRRFNARRDLKRDIGGRFASSDDVVRLALANLRTLAFVADVDDLPGLSAFIRAEFGADTNFGTVNVNVNKEAGSRSRYEIVASLAKSRRTLDRIREMAALDERLLDLYRQDAENGLGAGQPRR